MKLLQAKPAMQLGAFALSSALLLAAVNALTGDTIKAKQAEYTRSLLKQIVVDESAVFEQTEMHLGEQNTVVWQVTNSAGISHVIIPATSKQGYSGAIDLLIGLDADLNLAGVRVTKHRETPGLGDKIEWARDPWITQFKGLSLKQLPPEQWAVKKDGGAFDQFTGATITPRAVVRAVRDTLVKSSHYQQLLFTPVGQQP